MTPSNIEVLVLTVPSVTEDIAFNDLVGFDGGPAGADEPVLGTAKNAATVGEALAVVAIGLVEMVAPVALAAGDKVYSDADGKPTNIGQENSFGVVLNGGGVGDVVAILKS